MKGREIKSIAISDKASVGIVALCTDGTWWTYCVPNPPIRGDKDYRKPRWVTLEVPPIPEAAS